MEEREVGPAVPRGDAVGLRAHAARRPPGPARRPRNRAEVAGQSNLARGPMPSARLLRQLTDRRVPLRTRLELIAAEARRRLRPSARYAVHYGRARCSSPRRLRRRPEVARLRARGLVRDGLPRRGGPRHRRPQVLRCLRARPAHGSSSRSSRSGPERRAARVRPRSTSGSGLARAPGRRRRGGGRGGAARDERVWGPLFHPPDAFAEYEVGTQRDPGRRPRNRPRGRRRARRGRSADRGEGQHRGRGARPSSRPRPRRGTA